MNDTELHRLRNAVNVISIALPLLRRQLGAGISTEAAVTMHALEVAAEECSSLTVVAETNRHSDAPPQAHRER